ncbi:sugar transferase [Desulforhopalus sp. IMCC35007]|uniref:sugar transferase n=1 Tax=Desulforhopalus sp. IMCC35007 TaxID=2569543 RepID=UPI0010ADF9DB|nr:sugar transferase [Desulforhopalus sp. IMCC35007]TKB09920.1 sugar transferase [Desulforhopalus sp. IMCC35007]
MKRVFDFSLAFLGVIVLIIPMCIIGAFVKITSRGPILYWSARVGQNNTIFQMPKFRTMYLQSPVVATHLIENPDRYVTSIGGFLRKSSLDELPQLFCILKGQMSFVGPRPALYNQEDLIGLRTQAGVHVLVPGLTGWAQINGRDDLEVSQKVSLDSYYLIKQSFKFDIKIIIKTIFKIVQCEGIKH